MSSLPRRGRLFCCVISFMCSKKMHTDESKEEDGPTVRSFRRRRRYGSTPAPSVTEIQQEESGAKESVRPTESAITEAPKTKVVTDDLASIRKMEKLHEERIQVNTGDLPTTSVTKEETHSHSATEVVNPLLSSYCVLWREGIMISESDEAASLAFVFSRPRVSHLRHPVGERDGGGNSVVRSVASGRGDEPEDVASVDAGRDCDRYGIVLVSSDHHHIINPHQFINSRLVNSYHQLT